MIAVDVKRKVYFSFNSEIQQIVETFMSKLGYENTDYYLDLDEPGTILKLSNKKFYETEVLVLSAMSNTGKELVETYFYVII